MRKDTPTLTLSELHGIERRLLGSVLAKCDPDRVLDHVGPSDFSNPVHADLCKYLQDRRELRLPLDLPTVYDALMEEDPLNLVARLGGPAMLAGESLIDAGTLSDEMVQIYIATVKRASCGLRMRKTMRGLDEAIQAGDFERSAYLRGILQTHLDQADAQDAGRDRGGEPTLEDPMETWTKALTVIEDEITGRRGPAGLAFGLPLVDEELTPGLRPGRFMVIGAGTGEGKTVLALMMALRVARQGRGVLYLSWEMSGEELLERAAAMESRVSAWRIQQRRLSQEDKLTLLSWAPPEGLLLPLVAGMRARLIPQLVKKARKRLEDKGCPLALVVVDHLQVVRAGEKVETRALEVKEVANACKELALDGSGGDPLAVLALSQLNRARDTENPALWNLKESGGIEEAADTVLLLSRKRCEGRIQKEAKLTVAKNRGGPVGRDLALTFDKLLLRFR